VLQISHIHRKKKSGGCSSNTHNSAKTVSCAPSGLNSHNEMYPLQRYFL